MGSIDFETLYSGSPSSENTLTKDMDTHGQKLER